MILKKNLKFVSRIYNICKTLIVKLNILLNNCFKCLLNEKRIIKNIKIRPNNSIYLMFV